MTALRAAVYTDYAYHRTAEGVQAERAFALFIAALSRQIDRVILVGRLHPDPAGGRYPVGDRVEFHALPHYESMGRPGSALMAMARSLGALWRSLDDVDCVWLLGPHPLAFPFAAMARLRRRRVILGVRQDFPAYVRSRRPGRRYGIAAWLLDRGWRALARVGPVVVVGPELAEHYRRSPKLLEVAVSLVAAGDVVSAELPRGRSYDGELTILAVGRLDAEKNPMILVDVLAELEREKSRWRMVVCGEGPLEGDLERGFREAGLADRVELRGYVPLDGGLLDLYRGSHAFLHVSWTEGLPQVLFEAFASGLPVVATDVGGVAATVGGAARLIPPGDPQAAATELRRLAGEPALRDELVDAGLELARAHTIEGESASLAEFLARCAA
jgi:glycosyltransferase involved in cell wall biosynthesis